MAINLDAYEINRITGFNEIITNFSSHKDIVKFTLFCAKDCFHLNTEPNKPIAQKCIQLVESWLINPKSVTQQQLLDATSVIDFAISAAAVVAAYAAAVAIIKTTTIPYAAIAAANALNAFFYANNNVIFYQKVTQYTHYAYSLLRSTNIIPTHTQGTIADKATLMALLDELSEQGEDLVTHENNLFTLNYPSLIATNTLPELVDTIWNDSSLLHYMEHLYGNSKTLYGN